MSGVFIFDLDETLHRVRHWLPQQGPIKDFVHHNTLHAFQHLKFHDAVRAAAKLYNANCYMSASFYLDAYKSGSINDDAIERALSWSVSTPTERPLVKQRLFAIKPPAKPTGERIRDRWQSKLGGPSLDRLVHPILIRLIGGYLDQGLSLWRLPGADQLEFYSAVVSLVQKSWLPLKPLNSPGAQQLLRMPANEAVYSALHRLVGHEDLFEDYIREALLALPGWAGLVSACEMSPASLLSARAIRLVDYAAISLALEVGALEQRLGPNFSPLERDRHPVTPDSVSQPTDTEFLLSIWQDAYEWSYYEGVLGGVAASTGSRSEAFNPPSGDVWAFFCIDDRECSLRRHLEEVDPQIETFATAGFFGLDFMYKGIDDSIAGKHCPVLMTPQHLIIEEAEAPHSSRQTLSWWRKIFSLEPEANTFFRGWVLSYALGFGAALRLAASVFKPSLNRVAVQPLSTVNPGARLRLSRDNNEAKRDGLWVGYSISELADRVKNLLKSSGALNEVAQKGWPSLIAFFGHGSSSVNNPYFAAYNCGACSGRMGAPNARAFAEAANMRDVRELLRQGGIAIPESTWFIGALHDTARDEVTYYDTEKIPTRMRIQFHTFSQRMQLALSRNSLERCRRFDTVSNDIKPEAALAEVRTRAVSLFEPRPEYNHATNAACIIGRRRMTEDLFLDRRAFLSSYDPNGDETGEQLTQMLGAVIPVCAGINLEYYFSRVDPTVYGSGSKLSHNVTGLIGVANGIEGDILTGLPTQMTEIHDPVRLLLIVEQDASTALAAAKRDPNVFEWINNEWVRFACIEPKTKHIYIYAGTGMHRLTNLPTPRVVWRNSLEAVNTSRRNLPAGRLQHQ